MATADEDRALMALYELLKSQHKPGFTDLDADGQREYKRKKQAEARAAQKVAAEAGSPVPSAANVREALADIALRMLSTDTAGAVEVRKGLVDAFPGRAGVPSMVTRKAKSGTLRPRLLKTL